MIVPFSWGSICYNRKKMGEGEDMEGFWQMLSIQMLLFIYMAIGYGLRKGGILKAEARDAFTEFVILVTLPCMIFESFQIALTVETLQKGS